MDSEPRSPIWWIPALVLACGMAFVVHTGPLRDQDAPPTVDEIQDLIRERYVRPVNDRDLRYGAIRGMIGELDPFSSFLTPEQATRFEDEMEGEYGGLGIYITLEDGFCKVIAPLEGTPAFEAGILPGDRIIEVEGRSAEFESVEDATRVLKGEPGSEVTLTILHEGSTEPVHVTLTRERITVESVKWLRMVDPEAGIGYFRLSAFQRETAGEVREAIRELAGAGLRRLIIDLRSNPGGILDTAVEVADLFLEEGLVVRTRGRADPRGMRFDATPEESLPPFPLAILVDGTTASAAEILAGALRGHDRAILVGSRTFGKGSVQSVIELSGGTRLKLTTAHYVVPDGSPDGRAIHRSPDDGPEDEWGLVPDVPVEMLPADLRRIYRARQVEEIDRLQDHAEEANGDGSGDPVDDESADGTDGAGDEEVPVDRQLRAAIERLREMEAPPTGEILP